MRRPGIWVAYGQPQDSSQMFSWQPGAVASYFEHLVPNNIAAYKAANPDVPLIVRFQHPRNWQQNPAESSQQLGQQVAAAWDQLQALDPYVVFANHMNMHYENGDPNPANQHLYTTPQFYQTYAAWLRQTADVIKNSVPDMKLVTPAFAFGFNEDGSPNINGEPMLGWAGYDYLQETIRDYFDNILTFHAYWGYAARGSVPDWLYEPELSSWYAFRWQRVLRLFQARYSLQANLIIDEVASFGTADPDFTDQMIYYAEQCLSDPRVLALTYFLWANPANEPRYRQNSWLDGIPDLDGHLNRLRDLPEISIIGGIAAPDTATDLSGLVDTATDLSGLLDTAEPALAANEAVAMAATEDSAARAAAQTIRVLHEDDTVQVMPLEAYLRAVVPGEMPALWPEEALKAQAVASRTYAQYAIEHPRHHPRADICTTTHCQHYAPDKIHERSDTAIEQTRGLIVLYEGQTANGIFSARCGGHTRNNEDVFSGRPLAYLRGVSCPDVAEQRGHAVGFCQHGARVFSQQGRPYAEILKHYYQGTTLGFAPPPLEG